MRVLNSNKSVCSTCIILRTRRVNTNGFTHLWRSYKACVPVTKMSLSLVFLCTAVTVVLFHGVNCHLFPQALLKHATNVEATKVYKHQIDDGEMLLQCALERFNAFYQGNTSNFVSQCRSIFIFGADPSAVNIFRTFCIPDCGNVVLDAFVDCGISREERNTAAGLCGSNENGDTCYELISGGVDLLINALSCAQQTECNCGSILEEVERQGCCIVDINDHINRQSDSLFGVDFDLGEVYDNCNVDVPERGCNNSPLSGSSFLHASYISFVGTFFVIFVNRLW